MKHPLQKNGDRMIFDLNGNVFPLSQSNPKKATKRFIVWWLLNGWLLCCFPTSAESRSFTSLTLCADRLLTEIVRPEQIAALSTFSTQDYAMLRVNHDTPTVRTQLSDLIPYAHTTILLNEHFYPHLAKRLHDLGFHTEHIDDNPQSVDAFFALTRQIGELSDNTHRAEKLISKLKAIEENLSVGFIGQPKKTAMVLADSGVIMVDSSQYQQFFRLLNLTPTEVRLGMNFSPEQLLRANPEILITQRADEHYSDGANWFEKPLLNRWKQRQQGRAMLRADSKYFFCFDHGIWLGAEKLAGQLAR